MKKLTAFRLLMRVLRKIEAERRYSSMPALRLASFLASRDVANLINKELASEAIAATRPA